MPGPQNQDSDRILRKNFFAKLLQADSGSGSDAPELAQAQPLKIASMADGAIATEMVRVGVRQLSQARKA